MTITPTEQSQDREMHAKRGQQDIVFEDNNVCLTDGMKPLPISLTNGRGFSPLFKIAKSSKKTPPASGTQS
jgi:hypothetical protein